MKIIDGSVTMPLHEVERLRDIERNLVDAMYNGGKEIKIFRLDAYHGGLWMLGKDDALESLSDTITGLRAEVKRLGEKPKKHWWKFW